MYPGPGQAGVANTTAGGAATTTGAGATTTGAATTGTGSGMPNEKPKLTPAWADTAATPIKVAARSTLVFINFIFLIFSLSALAASAASLHLPLRETLQDLAEEIEVYK
jgi:hypothetical protein